MIWRASSDGRQCKTRFSDDVLRAFAIFAEPAEVRDRVIERYGGITDRVGVEWMSESPALLAAIAGRRA